jgi:hypothetical protein
MRRALFVLAMGVAVLFSPAAARAEEQPIEFEVILPENWAKAEENWGGISTAVDGPANSPFHRSRRMRFHDAVEDGKRFPIAEVSWSDSQAGKVKPLIASVAVHWMPPYSAGALNGRIVIVAAEGISLQIVAPANATLDADGNSVALNEPIKIKPGRVELRFKVKRESRTEK